MRNSIEALQYLQTNVSEIINHDDEEQRKEVRIVLLIILYDIVNSIELDNNRFLINTVPNVGFTSLSRTKYF